MTKHQLTCTGTGSERVGLWQPHGTETQIAIESVQVKVRSGSLEARASTFSADAIPFLDRPGGRRLARDGKAEAPDREGQDHDLIDGLLSPEFQARPIEDAKGSAHGTTRDQPGTITIQVPRELGPDQGVAIEILALEGPAPEWTLHVGWQETKPGEAQEQKAAPSQTDGSLPPPTDPTEIEALRRDPATPPGSPYYPEKSGPVTDPSSPALVSDQTPAEPLRAIGPTNQVDSNAPTGDGAGHDGTNPQQKRRGR